MSSLSLARLALADSNAEMRIERIPAAVVLFAVVGAVDAALFQTAVGFVGESVRVTSAA